MMNYKPKFMDDLENYRKDRQSLKSEQDILEFNKKFYVDKDTWPLKTSEEKGKEAMKSRELEFEENGRRWSFVQYPYRLTPEAEFELALTAEITSKIAFPKGFHSPRESGEIRGWKQECAYCQISTSEVDLKRELCPKCGRKLFYTWTGD